jgi:hypothetical protein
MARWALRSCHGFLGAAATEATVPSKEPPASAGYPPVDHASIVLWIFDEVKSEAWSWPGQCKLAFVLNKLNLTWMSQALWVWLGSALVPV